MNAPIALLVLALVAFAVAGYLLLLDARRRNGMQPGQTPALSAPQPAHSDAAETATTASAPERGDTVAATGKNNPPQATPQSGHPADEEQTDHHHVACPASPLGSTTTSSAASPSSSASPSLPPVTTKDPAASANATPTVDDQAETANTVPTGGADPHHSAAVNSSNTGADTTAQSADKDTATDLSHKPPTGDDLPAVNPQPVTDLSSQDSAAPAAQTITTSAQTTPESAQTTPEPAQTTPESANTTTAESWRGEQASSARTNPDDHPGEVSAEHPSGNNHLAATSTPHRSPSAPPPTTSDDTAHPTRNRVTAGIAQLAAHTSRKLRRMLTITGSKRRRFATQHGLHYGRKDQYLAGEFDFPFAAFDEPARHVVSGILADRETHLADFGAFTVVALRQLRPPAAVLRITRTNTPLAGEQPVAVATAGKWTVWAGEPEAAGMIADDRFNTALTRIDSHIEQIVIAGYWVAAIVDSTTSEQELYTLARQLGAIADCARVLPERHPTQLPSQPSAIPTRPGTHLAAGCAPQTTAPPSAHQFAVGEESTPPTEQAHTSEHRGKPPAQDAHQTPAAASATANPAQNTTQPDKTPGDATPTTAAAPTEPAAPFAAENSAAAAHIVGAPGMSTTAENSDHTVAPANVAGHEESESHTNQHTTHSLDAAGLAAATPVDYPTRANPRTYGIVPLTPLGGDYIDPIADSLDPAPTDGRLVIPRKLDKPHIFTDTTAEDPTDPHLGTPPKPRRAKPQHDDDTN
ncbi:hypothetical protein ACFPVT_01985 [Corynebacterium choanae]|uniref:Uncharacterized protein n=1 Tax=Corynebacterium choanae TaxID=1862358 RepID=A0A3G6J3K0_9CORY|nr:hypothetical protein [Corynebacterium choanae]AZA12645.1 hypothetical protein CCHOA_01085 [Corynebacterium choanae]